MIQNLRDRFWARRRNDEGFTLIELLVVVIIIGILAAIAIPTFLSQRQKAQDSDAKSAARNIASSVSSIATDCNGAYVLPTACTQPITLAAATAADTALAKYNVPGNTLTVDPAKKAFFTVVIVSKSTKRCTYQSIDSSLACA